MKHSTRLITAFLTFAIGTAAFFIWLTFDYLQNQTVIAEQQAELVVTPPEGKVTLRFLECAGKISVFVFDNQTERSTFARFWRVDSRKEWKDANIQYGVHFVDYKATNVKNFKDVSIHHTGMPFKEIPAFSFVRYGVEFRTKKGEYKVHVPYLDDEEVAKRFDDDFISHNEKNFERNFASWKMVDSAIVTNHCQQ